MRHDSYRSVAYRALPSGPAAAQAARARRVLVACALAVASGVAALLTFLYPPGDPAGPEQVVQQLINPPVDWIPSPPVSVLPAPSSSFTTAPVDAGPTRSRATPRTTSASTSPKPSAQPAPAAELKVGATVGLAVAAAPDYRVRHRDFIGRVDRFGSGTDARERADSQFVVRNGLGRDGCISLESVNLPGYFLRHRDFVLRLDRRDRSELFAQDATFCTAPARGGTAFVLESINYPGRALVVHRDYVIYLDTGQGTAFVVRSPV
ncbi:AbfB domain-containing protein [Actinoplanes sp. KI2]|uniref:AbfB domain-containing protein n=1 Tax=Actinoplanes sp. KI2 TaxID=2983315 RepID=UPI0021D59494|nr:AbfB domain-containing protein [Actinoplanes sp. KI2]MCU7729180.1 AbfB domain-containing protein [Actinoplanes sp. KI2]